METALAKIPSNLPTTTFKLNPDELFFINNDQKHTIKQYETLKIEDNLVGYKGAELARYHIGKALETMFELVGLKKENYPSRELGRTFARYIQDTFPFINPYEIVTAVEFGLQGKYNNLKSDGKSIFEHYGTMDLPFINTFMQAYVKFRYEKKVAITNKLENSIVPTKAEVIELMKKDDEAVKSLLREAFKQYKESPGDKVNWLRDSWFHWLTDIGMIPYDKEKLNERFRQVKKVRWDLSSGDCFHIVCVEKIYEMFARLKDEDKAEPFADFDYVTYINADTYKQLGHAKA